MELVIITFATIQVYLRARAAQLSAGTWALYNVLSMLGAMCIGVIISSIILVMTDQQLVSLMMEQQGNQQVVLDYLQTKNMLVTQFFILFCALGGFLFIRYRLDKIAPLPPKEDS